MKVKIVQRKNPQKPDEPGKFYGQPVLDGVVGMDMICRQIAGRSSLTAGDVKNVLTNFLDELPTYMLMNRSVQLEDFGILRISFGSEGVDRAEDFSSSLIRGVKIVFTPSAKMKERVKSEITFEVINRPAPSSSSYTPGESD